MTADEIYFWWAVWLVIATVIVIATAALLIAVVMAAQRILRTARVGLAVVGEIEQNTKAIWQLNDSHKVAEGLLSGAEAILGNAGAIADALAATEEKRVA
ncbi:MAG: hypothetical protein CTY31_13805 [Hyphomicrobium sp.]|nr:MAG: hypothetical protein CTY31_13805 [Hyphomicrobium sp.]